MISTTNGTQLSSLILGENVLFQFTNSGRDFRKREPNFLIPFREEKTLIKAFVDGLPLMAFGKADVLHHGIMALLEFCSKLLFTYLSKNIYS